MEQGIYIEDSIIAMLSSFCINISQVKFCLINQEGFKPLKEINDSSCFTKMITLLTWDSMLNQANLQTIRTKFHLYLYYLIYYDCKI